MQKHIKENGNVIYSYESLENVLNNSNINFIGNNNILFLSSNLKLYDSTITFNNNNNSIGFCVQDVLINESLIYIMIMFYILENILILIQMVIDIWHWQKQKIL